MDFGYNGRSRECAKCGSHWPTSTAGTVYAHRWCPTCGIATTASGHDVDEDWAEKLGRPPDKSDALPPDDDTELGIIPLLRVEVIEQGGQLWLDVWEVARARTYPLRVRDIVRVFGGELYEVLERVDSKRLYWVQPFSFKLSDDDLRELSVPGH